MFNTAIFKKTLRDSSWTVVLVSIGMAAFSVLFAWSMLDMGAELLKFVSQIKFIKKMFEMGFGIDVSGEISITVLWSLCFTHGLILMLSWGAVIATVTRVLSGEVERGTADILMTLPVNRHEVYFSTSLVWILASVVLPLCPLAGLWMATQIFEVEETVEIFSYGPVVLNFFALLLAIGGISSLVSSLVNRRGIAVALVASFLFVSTALNFVEPFIEAIHSWRFASLLTYCRPVDVMRDGGWPWFEVGVLSGAGFGCWLIGLMVFCRKDIPTG